MLVNFALNFHSGKVLKSEFKYFTHYQNLKDKLHYHFYILVAINRVKSEFKKTLSYCMLLNWICQIWSYKVGQYDSRAKWSEISVSHVTPALPWVAVFCSASVLSLMVWTDLWCSQPICNGIWLKSRLNSSFFYAY